MIIYKLTAKASQTTKDGRTLHDTSEHYIAAYDYTQAQWHVHHNLTSSGWNIDSILGKELHLYDIRDKSDHTTD